MAGAATLGRYRDRRLSEHREDAVQRRRTRHDHLLATWQHDEIVDATDPAEGPAGHPDGDGYRAEAGAVPLAGEQPAKLRLPRPLLRHRHACGHCAVIGAQARPVVVVHDDDERGRRRKLLKALKAPRVWVIRHHQRRVVGEGAAACEQEVEGEGNARQPGELVVGLLARGVASHCRRFCHSAARTSRSR